MNETKIVSLITPCYNAGPYLKEYLRSVCAQTYRPLELIFVNDGSTDASESIYFETETILNHAGIRTNYFRIPHSGQSAAINAGLKVFTGEYLTWADADDILKPECIGRKIQFLEEHPEVGMVRNDAAKLQNGALSGGIARDNDRQTQLLFEKLFMESTYVYAGCYMIRRSLFEECYPELTIPFSKEGQNLQMLLPPASRTVCGFVDEVLMIYRIHEGSHAFHKRTRKEMLDRISGFEVLYRDLKPYCRYDGAKYDELLTERISLLRRRVVAAAWEDYKLHRQ